MPNLNVGLGVAMLLHLNVYAVDPGQCDGWYAMWEDYGDQDMCIGEACWYSGHEQVACEYACGGFLQTCREILEDTSNIEGGSGDGVNEAVCSAGQYSLDGACFGCPSGYYQPQDGYTGHLCEKCPDYPGFPSIIAGSWNWSAFEIDGWDLQGAVGAVSVTQCYVMGNSSEAFSDEKGRGIVVIENTGMTARPGYDEESENTFCMYEEK